MTQISFDLDQKAIGQRIKAARKNKLMTQEKLAELIGISLNFYGMIERGEKGLSVKTLAHICDVLGENIDYIVTGKVTTSDNIPMFKNYNSLSPSERKSAEDMFDLWIKSIHSTKEHPDT